MVLSRAPGIAIGDKGGAGVFAVLLLFICACTEPEPPYEFREAFAALDKALNTERLEASSFAPRFPNPTPKQVVSYLLSQAGAEVLQVSTPPLKNDVDMLSDIPVWPSSITLWHTTRQPYGKRSQVILTWNDEERTILASATMPDHADPLYTRTWTIGPLSPLNEIDSSDTREFQAF